MTWWQALVVALAGAGAGGLIGLAGSLVSVRVGRRDQQLQQADERRQRGLELSGRVLAVLDDVDPLVTTINVNDQTPRDLEDAQKRWREIREPLVMFATSHPARSIRTATDELIVGVTNALTSLSWTVRDMMSGVPIDSPLGIEERSQIATARHDAAEAKKLAEGLIDLIHNDGRPPEPAALPPASRQPELDRGDS